MNTDDMIRGLARAAMRLEQHRQHTDSRGVLWDDDMRHALDEARRRGLTGPREQEPDARVAELNRAAVAVAGHPDPMPLIEKLTTKPDEPVRIVVGSIVVTETPGGICISRSRDYPWPGHVEHADIEDLHKTLGQYLARKSLEKAKPIGEMKEPHTPKVDLPERCPAWTNRGWFGWLKPEDGIRCSLANGHDGAHRTADGTKPTHAEYVAAIDRATEIAAGSKREPVRDASGVVAGYKEPSAEDPPSASHPDASALNALTRSLSEMLGCQDHPIAIQDRVREQLAAKPGLENLRLDVARRMLELAWRAADRDERMAACDAVDAFILLVGDA